MQSREPYGGEEGFRKVTLPLRIWAMEKSIARAKTEDKQANMPVPTQACLHTLKKDSAYTANVIKQKFKEQKFEWDNSAPKAKGLLIINTPFTNEPI